MTNTKMATLSIVYCAMSVALIAVCSWISIPLVIPFTLQTFAVCLITALLGLKRGTISVIVYILLGAVGLPVFSGFKGGFGALFGVTGGYIIGFIFTALIIGAITKKWGNNVPTLIISMALGILTCYAFGTAWFMILYTSTKGSISLGAALMMCVVPYLIPDAAKIALAVFLTRKLSKRINL